jgi:hypothetical protein
MKAALVKRPQRLEECELPNPGPANCSSATSRSCRRITPESGTLLPWTGCRTGSTKWEERPGLAPANEDEDCSKTIIRINLLEANTDSMSLRRQGHEIGRAAHQPA